PGPRRRPRPRARPRDRPGARRRPHPRRRREGRRDLPADGPGPAPEREDARVTPQRPGGTLSPAEQELSNMSSGTNAARPHVLVVDDEEDLCELIALRLEHNGYRVTCEQTTRGVIDVLQREIVHAVFFVLRLDCVSGLYLLADALQRSIDLPVVFLHDHCTIETAVEALERDAYGFFTKP